MRFLRNVLMKRSQIIRLILIISVVFGCSRGVDEKPVLFNPEQMNSPEYTIGVGQGTAAMMTVETKFPKCKIEYHVSLPDGYLGVKYGKIDAFAFDRHALQYVAIQNPDLALMDDKIGDESIVVGAPRGREDLIRKVNAFIEKYRADGTYVDMYKRWILASNTKMPDLPEPENPTMTLKIGTDGRNEPMNFYQDGRLTGFDIEFARRLGFFLNAKCVYSAIEYPAIVTALVSGKIDLLIANMNATSERRKMVLFSEPYVDSEISFLVRKDRLPTASADAAITQISQFAGRKVGVKIGTIYEDVLKEAVPDAVPVYFTTITDELEALKSGKIAGFLVDEVVIRCLARQTPGITYLPKRLRANNCAFAFPKNKSGLQEKVNAVLQRMKEDGTLKKLNEKWFGADEKAKVLPDIKLDGGNGTIRFATNSASEPFVYVKNGKMVGFDIELAMIVASKLGCQLQIMDMDFAAIIPSLVSGKTDMAGDFIAVTPERAKSVLFSIPYYSGGTVFVVTQKGDKPDKQGFSDFTQLAGKKVGIITGSVYDNVLKEKNPKAVPEYFNNFTDQIEALKAGKISAFLVDEPMARDILNRTSGVTVLKDMLTSDGYAFAFPKSQSKLQQDVNKILQEMIDDGTLKKIDARWFGTDEAARVLPNIRLDGRNGVIRLATNSGAAPFVYLKNGEIVGYDIEIAMRIAEKLGRRLEMVDTEFSAIIPALVSHKADMAVCGITVTEERTRSILFSIPDYKGGISVMVAADPRQRNIQSISDLSGKKVGIVTGSAYDNVLKSKNSRAIPEYFNNFPDQTEALKSGKIAAYLVDEPMARDIMNHSSGVTTLKQLLTSDGYAFALAKSQTRLHREVDAALAEMIKSGTLKEIDKRWFGTNEAAKVLPAIRLDSKKGVIRLATNSGMAPFAYLKDGRIVGYDIEIAMRIAAKLGRSLEIVDMEIASIIPSLVSGKSDMAACGITVTEERARSVLFSIPNYRGGIALMIAAQAVDPALHSIQNLAGLAGKKVGVLTGSTYDGVLKKNNPQAIPDYYNNFSDQTEALKTGKIAGFLVDEPIARDIMSHSSGVRILKELLTSDGYAFAFPKNRADLQHQANELLNRMKADGTLKKLEDKWFGTNDAARVLPEMKTEGGSGVLRLATNGNLAPFAYIKNGKMVGYDIEIAMLVAAKLNRRLDIADMDFAAIIPSLVSGKSDMGAGGIIVTEERAKSVLFSIPDYKGGVAVMVASAAGGPQTAGGGFRADLLRSFERTFVVEDRYKLVLQGLWVTVIISVLSAVFGTILGFGICLMRRAGTRWANLPAKFFIRAIQGTPIVVLLMILYYIVFGSVDINAIAVAVIGFSINFAAYVSEMMRTGIEAVDKGQREAAYAIGFSRLQVFTKITFPQAARYVLPVFKGEFISMLKMTSVVGYIAIQDLTKMSDIIRSRTYEAFFPLIATAVIYFIIAYIMVWLLNRVEMRVDPRQRKRVVKGVEGP